MSKRDTHLAFVEKFRKSARESRLFMRVSQREVAKRIGTSQSAIARFEAGLSPTPL